MRKVIPFLMAAAVVAAMIWQSMTPETVLMPEPEVIMPEFEGAVFEDLEMSEAESNVLPKDTRIFRRMYRFEDGRWFQLSVVVGGRSKSSVHRPELCLPGQGYRMTEPHTITAGTNSWRKLRLERNDSGLAGFAYTFVNDAGFRTSSHLVRIFTDVWDRSIHGRIDRWVMLNVVSSCYEDAAMIEILNKMEGVVK